MTTNRLPNAVFVLVIVVTFCLRTSARLAITSLLIVALYQVALADSPPNITTDIAWSAGFNGVADIEAAFNNARRQEETQLSLTANVLGNLNLPSQAVWDTFSDDDKALLIMNAERTARAGMQAGVIGLPFEDMETNLHNLAQNFAQSLVDNNAFDHEVDGIGPFERIVNDPALGSCHEFLSRVENLSFFVTTGNSISLPLERAIYGWLYEDSDSNWGHREAVLLQDTDLTDNNPLFGFNNNVSSSASEGFIGIGVVSDPNYNPFNFAGANLGVVVVFNLIDPISTGSCPWDGATGLVFRVERTTGDVYADGSFMPSGADLAERINVSEPVESGDVVELDPTKPNQYRKARGGSNLVAGAITTDPGFILGNNNKLSETERPMLALLGRVPVKATTENGPIRPGDLLTVSSKPGYAMRCTEAKGCEGSIIGKALEGLERGEGLILVLVMSH